MRRVCIFGVFRFVIQLCVMGGNSFAQIPEINGIVADEMHKQHIEGLSLGIVRNGEVLLSRGYGMADENALLPATDSTVYEIGSLSKHIIAVCILRLEEEGKLDINDHISRYFPDAPATWSDMTIRTLLDHTAGLKRDPPNFDWSRSKPDSFYIKAAYRMDLDYPTGKGWLYSNLGYFMLADIIRKTSGFSFEQYTNLFFRAIGMDHTSTTNRGVGPLAAKSYKYDEGTGRILAWTGSKNEPVHSYIMRPSGAFSSTIKDMIKWDSIQRHSDLLTPAHWAQMWQDTVRSTEGANGHIGWYGYGWGVSKNRNGMLLTHTGTAVGFKSAYWHGIDEPLSIIVLTNTGEAEPNVIAQRIYRALHQKAKNAEVSGE